jgi:serine/threonine-protein kinase
MSRSNSLALGRYELLTELGRGGMAELFLGRLRGAGGFAKLVAIKRILPHLAEDPQFTQMFLEESRIASRLSHPNVCQVFELGEEAGSLFLVMEYLDGVSWDHLLAALPELDQSRLARITAGVLGQAAEGLHHAHTLRDLDGTPTPVVHRDVSPQNLFLTVAGVCKVLDFGVSKMMTDGPRTRSGVVKGKLPYMSPEQIRGEPLDARADVFSLGVIAWEALARRRLYDRDTDFLIWKAITEEDAPPLTGWPPAIAAVVHRALSRDREQRQPTALAFAEELRSVAGFAAAAELAEEVRTRCGDRLAARARSVATVVGDRPVVETAVEDAGATLDLGSRRDGVRLRDASVVVRRDPPPRSHARTAIFASLIAAAITATIVAIVLTRGSSTARVPVAAIDAAVPDAPAPVPSFKDLRTGLEKMRDTLQTARDSVHGLTGTYVIEAGPGQPAAKIFVDGIERGQTPLGLELSSGSHVIRAVLGDGREQEFDIEIVAGKQTTTKPLVW